VFFQTFKEYNNYNGISRRTEGLATWKEEIARMKSIALVQLDVARHQRLKEDIRKGRLVYKHLTLADISFGE
jgi:hypothetical protein